MSPAEERRVGWCPGALRPMLSGDGLIVRVKPRGSRLTLLQASRLGELSLQYGNGDLDLTSRANLQIRGVTEAGLPALTGALDELGLLDPSPEAEAVRNVIGSPLAGLDGAALLDIRPIIAGLEQRLVSDARLHALPAKFGFVIDDGGRFGLDDVPADVRFRAFRSAAGPRFAISLGKDTGCPRPTLADARATASRGGRDGACSPKDLVETAVALALSRKAEESGHRLGDARMRDAPVGPQPGDILGLAARFGRVRAEGLVHLVQSAADEGAAELRLTPWRAVLVPYLDSVAAGRVAAACAGSGWIVDPTDPRLGIAACPGAPGCRRGTTPVLDHAASLADLLPRRAGHRTIALHVSGCGKGCAHRGEAGATLVGHDGVYDLVLGGGVGSEPTLRDLTVPQVASRIEAWVRGERDRDRLRLHQGRRRDLCQVLRDHPGGGGPGPVRRRGGTCGGAPHPCLRHGGGGLGHPVHARGRDGC